MALTARSVATIDAPVRERLSKCTPFVEQTQFVV
jgi:hypothetical protein